MKDLRLVVELYRKSNHPIFNGYYFCAEIPYTKEIKEILTAIISDGFTAGSFKGADVDGQEIYEIQDIPETGSLLTYTFNVTQSSANKFYLSMSDFLQIKSLKKGVMPESYYIVQEDYSSFDNAKNSFIIKVEKICQLIVLLSKLAHFHDIKNDSNGTFYTLVFILHSESKSTSAVIETNLNEKMLDVEEIDLNLINSLVLLSSNTDAHYIEKINTFRNTIIEYVINTNNNFSNIVANWKRICELYSNNLAVYMSAFSFHKAKKEVSEAEIDYADKISKVVSEIATKSLAIPVSLVAAITIFQVSSTSQAFIAFMGVILTAIITSLLAISQKKQLDRISHAKEILFSSITHRLDSEQSEIKQKLDEAKKELKKNEVFCRYVLEIMLSLSWVPVCIGTLGLIVKFI